MRPPAEILTTVGSGARATVHRAHLPPGGLVCADRVTPRGVVLAAYPAQGYAARLAALVGTRTEPSRLCRRCFTPMLRSEYALLHEGLTRKDPMDEDTRRALRRRFPHLYAYGTHVGSLPDYVDRAAELAAEDDAPGDVWSYEDWNTLRHASRRTAALDAEQRGTAAIIRETPQGDAIRVWWRMAAITEERTRVALTSLADSYAAGRGPFDDGEGGQ